MVQFWLIWGYPHFRARPFMIIYLFQIGDVPVRCVKLPEGNPVAIDFTILELTPAVNSQGIFLRE
jgi:hypothetical protein